jgi:aryl-alcohol dehydrogenase-like predicted oxidoreductase
MSISLMLSTGRDEEEVFQTLTKAADLGITFWDTSDAYLDNEEIIGKWFRDTGRRDEIFLATKFGVKVANGKLEVNGRPEYVAEACQKSLERLGTDRIDLYYQQRVDTTVPIEKTVEAMAQLMQEGKVRHLGLSECSATTLRRACKVHKIAACQMEYSPFALDVETTGFLDAARDLGVKIVPYSPVLSIAEPTSTPRTLASRCTRVSRSRTSTQTYAWSTYLPSLRKRRVALLARWLWRGSSIRERVSGLPTGNLQNANMKIRFHPHSRDKARQVRH